MKKSKPEPAATRLDPDHPNYDAILLRRARLEAHRRRRKENDGTLGQEWKKSDTVKAAKKPTRRRKR